MPVPRWVVNVRSKGRCGSASAVRPAAFHASGPVGAEQTGAECSQTHLRPSWEKSIEYHEKKGSVGRVVVRWAGGFGGLWEEG